MRQVKLFRGLETEVKALEKEINAWLIHADCNVIQIFGNIAPQSSSHTASSGFLTKSPHAPSDIFLCIYYEADAPIIDPVHTPEISASTPEVAE